MLAGLKKRGSSGNTTPGERSRAAAAREQRLELARPPGALPLSPARLEDPQAHHVLQEADRAEGAALVREVRARHGLAQQRRLALDAHERPRPRGDVGPARLERRSRDGARGVVGGGGDHPDPPEPELALPALVELAERRRRRARAPASARRGSPRRAKRSSAQSRVRTSRSCVVEAFVCSPRVEPQSAWWHRSGIISRRWARAGSPSRTWAWSWKSVLNCRNWIPVRSKISSPRDLAQDALDSAVGTVVAVRDRVFQQAAACVEEPVVHGPRADAEALDRPRGRSLRRGQAGLEPLEDPRERPAQVTVARRGRVVEAVDLRRARGRSRRRSRASPGRCRRRGRMPGDEVTDASIQDLTPSDDSGTLARARGPFLRLVPPVAARAVGGHRVDGAARAVARHRQDRPDVGREGLLQQLQRRDRVVLSCASASAARSTRCACT